MEQSGENAGKRCAAMVLLRHTGSALGDHFDWMIQEGASQQSPLRTWRVMVRLDELGPGDWFIAEPLEKHRAAYLTYEGPVSGGRGAVKRVAWGKASVHGEVIEMEWDGGAKQRVVGMRVDDLAWRFEVRE